MSCRKGEREHQMADDEEHRAPDEHGCTLTLVIQEGTEERGDDCRADGEPAEDVGRLLGSKVADVALQHVGAVPLEREDGAVVEHAEDGHGPEALASEHAAQVAKMEFVFAAAIFLGLELAGRDQLLVEAGVHHAEGDEVDHSDEEQHGAEAHWSCYGAELGGDGRADTEDGEHAHAGDSHFDTHGEGHFLALEPFGYTLGNRGAGHFAAAAEDHESQTCHLGAAGKGCPPAAEPGVERRALEPLRYTDELDGSSHEHHACGKDAGEAYAHLVQDYTRDDEETAYIQDVLRSGVCAEHVGSPAALLLHEALQRTHDVHEHVAEEHHEGD